MLIPNNRPLIGNEIDQPISLRLSVIGLPAPNLHREIARLKTKYERIIIDGGGRVTATARALSPLQIFC